MAPNNHYINEYKRELTRIENARQNHKKYNAFKNIAIGAGVVAGGLGAIHVLHPKGIVGALDTVLGEKTQSAIKALSSVDYGQHLRSYFNDEYTTLGKVARDIKHSYSENYKKILKAEREKLRELQIEALQKRAAETSERLGKEIRINSMHKNILAGLDDLKSKLNEAGQKEVDRLINKGSHKLTNLALKSSDRFYYELKGMGFSESFIERAREVFAHSREFTTVDEGVVKTAQANLERIVNEHITKLHTTSRQSDSFVDKILSTAKDYANKQADHLQRNSKHSDFTSKVISVAEKNATEQISKLDRKPSSFLNKVLSSMSGYRKATAEDLLRLHKAGEFHLEKNTLIFLQQLKSPDKFIPDHRLLMHNGRLVDARALANLGDKLADAFSGGIIGRVLLLNEAYRYKQFKKKPVHILRVGHHQPILSNTQYADAKGVLSQTLYGVGDTIYSLSDTGILKPVVKGVHFTSGRYGRTRRLMAQLSGVNAPEYRNAVAEALDIAKSREPGAIGKTKNFFSKFKDDEWTPNAIARAFERTSNPGEFIENVHTIGDYLDFYARGIDETVLRELVKGTRFKDLSFATDVDIIESYKKLLSNKNVNELAGYTAKRFKRHYYDLIDSIRVVQDPILFADNELQTGIDLIRKDASRILFGALIKDNNVTRVLQGDLLKGEIDLFYKLENLFETGKISKKQYQDSLATLAEQMYYAAIEKDRGNLASNYMYDLLYGLTDQKQLFEEIVKDMATRTHPWYSHGPAKDFYDNFHADVLAINKTWDITGDTFKEQAQSVGRILRGTVKRLFTGSKDINDFTTADLFFYSMANIPNDVFRGTSIPLSLSDASLGSSMSALGNLFFKRVLPFQIAFQAMRYINHYSSEWDPEGYTIQQRYERAKAQTRLGLAKVKDALHITDALKWLDDVTPGNENLKYSLGSIPIVGWAAKETGIFSSKSYEEWVDYYITGEDPVRKGRHWILSSSPWMGEQILYYQPNSYRRVMSEWQYTETVYGSREEYWKHQWLPTPRYPFAPLHRLFNPYWFEKMHKKDRPYPLSGPAFDPNNPFTWALNLTIGRILKPQIDYGAGATEEDLKEQREEDYFHGIPIAIYQGGNLEVVNYIPVGEINGYQTVYDDETNTISFIPGVAGYGQVYSQGDLENINMSLKGRAMMPVVNANTQSMQEITNLNMAIMEQASTVTISSGHIKAVHDITNINEAIKNQSGEIYYVNLDDYGYILPHRTNMPSEVPAGRPQNPRSLGYQLKHGANLFKDLFGAQGFIMGLPFGDNGAGESVIDSADRAYAPSYRFWDMNLGGLGGSYSEGFRRIYNHPSNRIKRINTLPNMMPDWLPGENYFINFQQGDPYTLIPRGEIRLPGAAYESLHPLHPDEFGRYGAVDRAAILADVAPYSDEFKFWKQVALSKNLTPEERAFLEQALEQSRKQREQYFITPYKFIGNAVEKKTVTIKKFIDSKRFLIEETDEVFSLAGVNPSFNAEEEVGKTSIALLQEHMSPGTKVEIIIPKYHNEENIPTVVEHRGINVNRLLLNSGVPESNTETPIDIYVKHSAAGRLVGKTWELFAHANIPIIHNKFLAVESSIEHYENKQIYGKAWQDWSNPISDYVVPTYQSIFARHPLASTFAGAVPGYIIGKLLVKGKYAKGFAIASSVVSAIGSLAVSAHEISTGKAWIPKRREKQREIQEYFDILEYLKYQRLFNQYKELAREKERVDLEKVIKELDELQAEVRKKENQIKKLDKLRFKGFDSKEYIDVFINEEGRLEYKVLTTEEVINKKRGKLQEEILQIKENQILVGLGPYARKALEYREKYKSTLYGIDENSTYTQMYAALPERERGYFEYFANEQDPKKRKEILKLVPQNQRRLYQILWGEKPDKKPALEKYFSKHYLPDKNWIGWKEGVQLEDSMIKVAEDEGLDISDFGIWQDFSEDEKLTPTPYPVGGSFKDGTPSVQTRLRQVLKDLNLSDVTIEMTPRTDSNIDINIDIQYDVRPQLISGIQAVMGG